MGASFRSAWGGGAGRRRQAHEQGPAACAGGRGERETSCSMKRFLAFSGMVYDVERAAVPPASAADRAADGAGNQCLWRANHASPPHEQGAGLFRFVPHGANAGTDDRWPTSRGRLSALAGEGSDIYGAASCFFGGCGILCWEAAVERTITGYFWRGSA